MPSVEGMSRLIARRIADGKTREETPRETADAVLLLIGRAGWDGVSGSMQVDQVDEVTEVVSDPNSIAALAPVVASIVDAAEQAARVEILHRAADELRHKAMLEFDEHGSSDVRGAALWDAASHLNPDDGDALALGRRRGELTPEVPERAPDCEGHHEVQHRDGKLPWCNRCGWTRGRTALPPRKLGTPRGER
jgi:hypothetical protein